MTAALEVHDLHAYYGESHVLQGVSLDAAESECVAILGRNGAGKTTTISSIVGFVRPRGGSVRLRGAEIAGLSPHRIARAGDPDDGRTRSARHHDRFTERRERHPGRTGIAINRQSGSRLDAVIAASIDDDIFARRR